MKKGDRVKISKGLPEEFANAKVTILGTIESISGNSALVKPRYRHTNYVIKLVDLVIITEEEFRKKQKYPTAAKKRFQKALLASKEKSQQNKVTSCETKGKLDELTTKTIAKAKYEPKQEPERTVFGNVANTVLNSEPIIDCKSELDWLSKEEEQNRKLLLEEHENGGSLVYWITGIVLVGITYLIIKLYF